MPVFPRSPSTTLYIISSVSCRADLSVVVDAPSLIAMIPAQGFIAATNAPQNKAMPMAPDLAASFLESGEVSHASQLSGTLLELFLI